MIVMTAESRFKETLKETKERLSDIIDFSPVNPGYHTESISGFSLSPKVSVQLVSYSNILNTIVAGFDYDYSEKLLTSIVDSNEMLTPDLGKHNIFNKNMDNIILNYKVFLELFSKSYPNTIKKHKEQMFLNLEYMRFLIKFYQESESKAYKKAFSTDMTVENL